MEKKPGAVEGAATEEYVYVRRRRSAAAHSIVAVEPEGTDEGESRAEESTPFVLVSEIYKIFVEYTRKYKNDDISGSNRNIIFQLAKKDGRTQLELANLTHLKPPTVSLSLAKLEANGLIRREADSVDRRQTRVYLTEKGRELDNKGRDVFRSFEKDAMGILSEDEYATLVALLEKVKSNLIEKGHSK